jgi:N-acetylglucosamine malate deacetylase 1
MTWATRFPARRERWRSGSAPKTDDAARRFWSKRRWAGIQSREADTYRELLVELYGEEKGKAVNYAESFEVSEYGRQPSLDDLKRLFPFFGED